MNTQDNKRKEFFNHHAQGWLAAHYKRPETDRFDLHSDRIKQIVSTLALEPDSQVLDVGCGSGVLVPYLLAHLSDQGRLFEMDYAREMIRENKIQHRDDRITFICSDVLDMPFEPAILDAVICFACFPHFQQPERALARMAESLKPGGRLTISHLMSSEELADHHTSHTPVSGDTLPPRETMTGFVRDSGLDITAFEDRPGLYLLSAIKCPST
ncbi:MAG: class I SAM-dependent methyltransferase [Proteobacteria bacterium]|nr:class I SAM-dependent methyltransferase [Pseudomonadota bacterium]